MKSIEQKTSRTQSGGSQPAAVKSEELCQSEWRVECEAGELPQVRQTTDRTWITWSPSVSAFGIDVPVNILREQAEVIRAALQGRKSEGRPPLAEREAPVLRDWKIGNLTPLGVANALIRAGFNSRYATDRANALARDGGPAAPLASAPATAAFTDLLAEDKERGECIWPDDPDDWTAYDHLWGRRITVGMVRALSSEAPTPQSGEAVPALSATDEHSKATQP